MNLLTPILSVRGLGKNCRRGVQGYETTYTILRDLNLDVYSGECVAVVGPKGVGKTTLLYCLAGILSPTSGSVDWRLIRGESPRADIVYVPERTPYYGFLTVRETLEYYVIGSELSTAERAERIDGALHRVGLTEKRGTRICELDVTMFPYLRVAQALVGAPHVILLDELASGIPHDETGRMRETLRRCTDAGITIMMTSYDMQMASAIASRVIRLAQHPRYQGAVVSAHPLISRIALPMS